jgi:hypothetical protein
VAWNRAVVAKALYAMLTTAPPDPAATPPFIFERPPGTLNAPAVVVGRPAEVRYSEFALGIDFCEFIVVCVAAIDGDDDLAELIGWARSVIEPDPSLGGAVQTCVCTGERNWRAVRVAGADLLAAELVLEVTM